MEFRIVVTKKGTAVINVYGTDYTLPPVHHSLLWYKTCCGGKWSKLSDDDFATIKLLSEQCCYGKKKEFRYSFFPIKVLGY